jgi:hypothetical protein
MKKKKKDRRNLFQREKGKFSFERTKETALTSVQGPKQTVKTVPAHR